ncbi:unnamed protein product [Didymodactylos carnosus]|uniref:ADP ribosyltransferase domain-containing protein n=1 Tax=Didymodactylos carnosus TaxID=1234261 RepID=A0A8S2JLX7_9BILA|nr:unnamed protein product [Didymodactylos carnosus]CAF3814254.1 unnamed protein product [Didymodactylos carnosus]
MGNGLSRHIRYRTPLDESSVRANPTRVLSIRNWNGRHTPVDSAYIYALQSATDNKKVFISCTPFDQIAYEQINTLLAKVENCIIFSTGIGNYFDILDEIDCFIPCLSAYYYDDRQCQGEFTYAVKGKVKIIPISIQDNVTRFMPDWIQIGLHLSDILTLSKSQSSLLKRLQKEFIEVQKRNEQEDFHISHYQRSNPTLMTPALSLKKRSADNHRYISDPDNLEWTLVFHDPAKKRAQFHKRLNKTKTEPKIRRMLTGIMSNYIKLNQFTPTVGSFFRHAIEQQNLAYILKAYTNVTNFSGILNRHLAADSLAYFTPTLEIGMDYSRLKCLIDYIALVMEYTNYKENIYKDIAYRGLVLAETDLYKYVVGTKILNTAFLSTSRDRHVAEMFSDNTGSDRISVLCTYRIKNDRTALDLTPISEVQDEQEVLILPFSAFYVRRVVKSSKPTLRQRIEMELEECDEIPMAAIENEDEDNLDIYTKTRL